MALKNSGTANRVAPPFYLQLWHETYHGYRQIGYMISLFAP
ncbi:MAG: hypothetical protein M0Z85_02305 [Gammaproteobacteria bacterium]|nr:hypothetical protein [Gammaproteobacteria bacterium]